MTLFFTDDRIESTAPVSPLTRQTPLLFAPVVSRTRGVLERAACPEGICIIASPFAFLLSENLLRAAGEEAADGACAVLVGTDDAPAALVLPQKDAEALLLPFPADEDGMLPAGCTLAQLAALVLPQTTVEAPAVPTTRRAFFANADAYRLAVIGEMIDRGTEIPCTDGVMIAPDAQIGADTLILPGTELHGGVTVGARCVLGPSTVLIDTTVGDDCVLNAVQAEEAAVEDDVRVGPFCHLRPKAHLCRGVRIGDFVEVKNSVVGECTHASHLTYIGDSDIGARVNFGCGTVTVNYDGKNKARCRVGDDVFLGCNTNLVAPVTLGDGAFTAAGSTVTDDVPPQSLAIARARQVNKEGWAAARRAANKLK